MLVVTANMSYEQFKNLKNQAQDYKNAVDSLSSSFGTEASSLATSASGIQLDGWMDAVSTRYGHFIGGMKNGLTAIQDDIDGGAFSTLKSTLSSLVSGLDNCANLALNLRQTRNELNQTNKYIYVEKQDPYNSSDWVVETTINPDYTALEQAKLRYETALNTAVGSVNSNILTLNGLSFEGPVIEDGAWGEMTPDGFSTSGGDNWSDGAGAGGGFSGGSSGRTSGGFSGGSSGAF